MNSSSCPATSAWLSNEFELLSCNKSFDIFFLAFRRSQAEEMVWCTRPVYQRRRWWRSPRTRE
jgi:hypothetical protein